MIKSDAMKPSSGDDYTSEKQPHVIEAEVLSEAERDAQALARLGKKPILKVFPKSKASRT